MQRFVNIDLFCFLSFFDKVDLESGVEHVDGETVVAQADDHPVDLAAQDRPQTVRAALAKHSLAVTLDSPGKS